MSLTLNAVKNAVISKGYKWFEDKSNKGYDVNIVGIIKGNGESIINPDPNTLLNTNDIILLIGDEDKMSVFKQQLPS